MGNRTSRKTSQKKQNYSTNEIGDPENSDKLHTDSHYSVMDTVLHRHLILVSSNTDAQPSALNIHQNALNMAMEQHLNAVCSNSPNCQRGRQMVYTY